MLSLYFVYLDMGLDTRVVVCICLLATLHTHSTRGYSLYSHLLYRACCNACNDRCGSCICICIRQPAHQRAATARARPRPWPRRWKRRLHPAGRGRGWGLPLEAWRSELTSPGVYLLFPEGGNKHQREGVYLAVYLVCICFQDKNTQIHAYPHPSPSVFNI